LKFIIAGTIAATVMLAVTGCSGQGAGPPTARAIAAKIGCTVRWQGNQFAAQDLKQNVVATGGLRGIEAEIYTFPDAEAESDWLHLAEGPGYSQNEVGPQLAVGSLWAVDPGGVEYQGTEIAHKLGGRIVSM
jgi:hypothetical protein